MASSDLISTEKAEELSPAPIADDLANASGHKQELERNFSLINICGIAATTGNSWTAIGGSVAIAIYNGGPPYVIYEFIAVSVFYWLIAASIAELASAMPSSSGVYHGASVNAGRYGRIFGWFAGWWNFFAWIFGAASMSSIVAQQAVAMYSLFHPSFVAQPWPVFVSYMICTCICCLIVLFGHRVLPVLGNIGLFFILAGVFITVIVSAIMPSVNHKPYASNADVWKTWTNQTGYSSGGLVFVLGMLNGAFAVGSTDCVAHLAEEVPQPSRNIPKAMAAQYLIGFCTATVYMIAIFYSIHDLNEALSAIPIFPLAGLYYQATGTRVGALGLLIIAFIPTLITAIGCYITAGRIFWTLSRDNATPFSRIFGRIHPKFHNPFNATLLCGGICTVMGCIYVGSTTAFNAASSPTQWPLKVEARVVLDEGAPRTSGRSQERQQRGGSCDRRTVDRADGSAVSQPRGGQNHEDGENANFSTPTETSALLGDSDGTYDPESGEQKKRRDWDDLPSPGDPSWAREIKMVMKASPPLIITYFLQFSINATSVFAVGRLGKQQLGAVALANMTAAMTCLAPFIGLATSLDTLCAQAYGDGRKHLVGLQCQRCFWFLMCAAIPVATLWLFSESILAHIVDAETARLASSYLKIMIFSIPAYITFETGKRILQAQGLFQEISYIILVVAPINIFVNWLLVWQLGLGFIGAPIGVVISRNLLAALLVLYIKFVNGSQCWGGFDKKALANWGVMIRLALPGMTMVLAEWLAFELITLLSSRFGTDYLAAQSAIFTIVALFYQIPFAVSVASSTRVAGLIGGGVVDSAQVASQVSVIVSCLISGLNIILCITLRWYIPLLLTSDEGVISIIANTLPVVAIAVFWDGVSAGAHGILRGIGKQSIGGPANIFGHYVVALPMSLTLAFYFGWKIKGMWAGITGGLMVVSLIEYFYILKADWQQAALEARDRNASG
ncbi:hypothetical protein PWT90_00996 [Aphanocladium album]|nr:hypothetical protein PWT90_00996 [Aphanocladium album]